MRYKSVGIAAAVVLAGALCADAASIMETQSVTGGFAVSSNTLHRLESVVGEISGAKVSGKSQRIVPGHSGTSHTPGVIADMAVSTQSVGEGEGDVTWTQAGRDGNVGQASTFEFKVATVPLNSSNFSSAQTVLSVGALTPGTTAQRLVTNLPPGQLYYMASRVRDGSNLTGRISPNTTFYTSAIAPDPVSSLSALSADAGAFNLSWNVTGDDGSTGALSPGYFRIDYSTDPGHSFSNTAYSVQVTTTASAGSSQFYPLSGLLGNATYFAAVYIGDEVTVYSGLSQIGEIVTMAYPPSLTGISDISTGGFTAAFSAGNTAGTQYLLEISSFSDYRSVSSSGWISTTSVNFSGLQPRTTYYARGKARNFSNVQTSYAELGSVFLPKVTGTSNPIKVFAKGLNINNFFIISWGAVVSDIAGNPVSVKSYDIYSSTAIGGEPQFVASVSSDTLSWGVSVNALKWYFVRAVDENNNPSDEPVWLKNMDGTALSVPDEEAYADMPKAVSDALAEEKITPVTDNLPEQETGNIRSAYKFYFVDETGNIILNADFPGEVSIVMPLFRNSGFQASSLPQAAYSAYDYAVFYDNGVEEVKLGGTVNPANGTISVSTRKTGVFKVRQVIRAQSFSITQTVPRKIFTPNGDGVWDEFNIIYENPAALAVTEAKVYDISGAEVGRLKPGSYGTDSLAWDGKKNGGEKAAAGIYIYQFKAGGKYHNGTMVLAR